MMSVRVADSGELHRLLSGKTIQYVAKNDQLLVVRCTDGTEVRVCWVDGEGRPVRGEPAVHFGGLHVLARPGKMFGKGRRVG